jgi:ABC-type oligopeptide transport system substrate-binding subunit
MKKMKRSIVLIFAVLAISASMFSSCKKSDDSAKAILMNHQWVLTSVETDNTSLKEFFDITYKVFEVTYEFGKNDKLTITTKFLFASDKKEGTWSISEDGNLLTINGETTEIKELTSKVLKTGPSKEVIGNYEGDALDYVIVYNAK